MCFKNEFSTPANIGSLSLKAHKKGLCHFFNYSQASSLNFLLGVMGDEGTILGNCLTPCL